MAITFAAALLLIPRFAERKLAERLERRGLSWSSTDASLSRDGLRFERVVISKSGEPLVRAGAMKIELRWLEALGDPKGAVEQVTLTDADVQLSVDDLRELRGGAATPGSSASEKREASEAALPRVQASDVRLKLRDAHGVLLDVDVDTVRLSPAGWEANVGRFELGSADNDFIALEDVRLEGPLEGRRPQLRSGEAARATLMWRSRRGDDAGGERDLVARLRAVRSALRSKSGDDAGSDSTTKRARLWTEDARLALKRARVLEIDGAEQQPILERLFVELQAEGDKSLRVKGEGATATGGSLEWDLEVVPGDAKIEGRVALSDVPLALFAPALPRLPFHDLERTRIGADLAITGRGLEQASVRGELSVHDLAFESERLARTPVGPISFTARGQGTWTPARRELSDLKGEVVSGDTRVLVTGALAWPTDGYHVELRAELPKTPCQSVFSTVPAGLLDDLASVRLTGDIAAKLEVLVDAANLDETKLDFDFQDKCRFVSLPEAMTTQRFAGAFTHRVLEPDGTMFELETGPGTAAWTPIELISPFMIQAVVAHEDGRFFRHRGFAETEIGAALARNLKAKAFKFGASTITMQLVKNVFLHRDKLLSRKFQEALIVWWLEQQVDKKWIMELYLNVIEYGTGIYGIRNAALHYFGTLPIQLSPAQAAFLATILPSPKAYDEQYARGEPSPSTKQRVAKFLHHMHARDRIDDEALAYGLEEIAQMRFYDPAQPPPLPQAMRGTAQPPPWQVGAADTWSDDSNGFQFEDGSFNLGF